MKIVHVGISLQLINKIFSFQWFYNLDHEATQAMNYVALE